MRPGGQPNMQQLMKQAQKMQQEMVAAREDGGQGRAHRSCSSGCGPIVTGAVPLPRSCRTGRIGSGYLTDEHGRPAVRPGGQPNMQQLMKQAQKMQQELLAAQQELADTEVTGSAGGGLVTATVTGSSELKSLVIDPSVVDPEDVETLQDLVVAAIRDANRAAQDLAGQRMGPLTQGMGGLGLPGM